MTIITPLLGLLLAVSRHEPTCPSASACDVEQRGLHELQTSQTELDRANKTLMFILRDPNQKERLLIDDRTVDAVQSLAQSLASYTDE